MAWVRTFAQLRWHSGRKPLYIIDSVDCNIYTIMQKYTYADTTSGRAAFCRWNLGASLKLTNCVCILVYAWTTYERPYTSHVRKYYCTPWILDRTWDRTTTSRQICAIDEVPLWPIPPWPASCKPNPPPLLLSPTLTSAQPAFHPLPTARHHDSITDGAVVSPGPGGQRRASTDGRGILLQPTHPAGMTPTRLPACPPACL